MDEENMSVDMSLRGANNRMERNVNASPVIDDMQQHRRELTRTLLSSVTKNINPEKTADLSPKEEPIAQPVMQELPVTNPSVSQDPKQEIHTLEYSHIVLKFANAIEALNMHLDIGGFTNDIFADINERTPVTRQQFKEWALAVLKERTGSKVVVGGKPITTRLEDLEEYTTFKYFFDIVDYNPEKIMLVLNKHNTAIKRSILDKVGIGQILMLHK